LHRFLARGACGHDPIAGSAYTLYVRNHGRTYRLIIGWDLILEYAVSNMAVSVGFSAHMVSLLDWFGLHPDPRWISPRIFRVG
jgi:APA family basic amino acid/polyamine antiporter